MEIQANNNSAKTAGEKAVSDVKNNQLIVFKLGKEEFGLMIDQIKEVVITPNITRVPLTPSYVRGVANIRGSVISIVDMEERFGLKAPGESVESEKPNYTLVIENDELKMGILVREVPNTLAISNKEIEQSPNIIGEAVPEKNYIKGLVKVGNRMIILIDIYKIISREDLGETPANLKF